uniref:PE-PGRS family protein n=1 Tax=Parastrongyloides trichosuri TaxID=131310 RepID=A0A0N4ZXT0_PARTI
LCLGVDDGGELRRRTLVADRVHIRDVLRDRRKGRGVRGQAGHAGQHGAVDAHGWGSLREKIEGVEFRGQGAERACVLVWIGFGGGLLFFQRDQAGHRHDRLADDDEGGVVVHLDPGDAAADQHLAVDILAGAVLGDDLQRIDAAVVHLTAAGGLSVPLEVVQAVGLVRRRAAPDHLARGVQHLKRGVGRVGGQFVAPAGLAVFEAGGGPDGGGVLADIGRGSGQASLSGARAEAGHSRQGGDGAGRRRRGGAGRRRSLGQLFALCRRGVRRGFRIFGDEERRRLGCGHGAGQEVGRRRSRSGRRSDRRTDGGRKGGRRKCGWSDWRGDGGRVCVRRLCFGRRIGNLFWYGLFGRGGRVQRRAVALTCQRRSAAGKLLRLRRRSEPDRNHGDGRAHVLRLSLCGGRPDGRGSGGWGLARLFLEHQVREHGAVRRRLDRGVRARAVGGGGGQNRQDAEGGHAEAGAFGPVSSVLVARCPHSPAPGASCRACRFLPGEQGVTRLGPRLASLTWERTRAECRCRGKSKRWSEDPLNSPGKICTLACKACRALARRSGHRSAWAQEPSDVPQLDHEHRHLGHECGPDAAAGGLGQRLQRQHARLCPQDRRPAVLGQPGRRRWGGDRPHPPGHRPLPAGRQPERQRRRRAPDERGRDGQQPAGADRKAERRDRQGHGGQCGLIGRRDGSGGPDRPVVRPDGRAHHRPRRGRGRNPHGRRHPAGGAGRSQAGLCARGRCRGRDGVQRDHGHRAACRKGPLSGRGSGFGRDQGPAGTARRRGPGHRRASGRIDRRDGRQDSRHRRDGARRAWRHDQPIGRAERSGRGGGADGDVQPQRLGRDGLHPPPRHGGDPVGASGPHDPGSLGRLDERAVRPGRGARLARRRLLDPRRHRPRSGAHGAGQGRPDGRDGHGRHEQTHSRIRLVCAARSGSAVPHGGAAGLYDDRAAPPGGANDARLRQGRAGRLRFRRRGDVVPGVPGPADGRYGHDAEASRQDPLGRLVQSGRAHGARRHSHRGGDQLLHWRSRGLHRRGPADPVRRRSLLGAADRRRRFPRVRRCDHGGAAGGPLGLVLRRRDRLHAHDAGGGRHAGHGRRSLPGPGDPASGGAAGHAAAADLPGHDGGPAGRGAGVVEPAEPGPGLLLPAAGRGRLYADPHDGGPDQGARLRPRRRGDRLPPGHVGGGGCRKPGAPGHGGRGAGHLRHHPAGRHAQTGRPRGRHSGAGPAQPVRRAGHPSGPGPGRATRGNPWRGGWFGHRQIGAAELHHRPERARRRRSAPVRRGPQRHDQGRGRRRRAPHRRAVPAGGAVLLPDGVGQCRLAPGRAYQSAQEHDPRTGRDEGGHGGAQARGPLSEAGRAVGRHAAARGPGPGAGDGRRAAFSGRADGGAGPHRGGGVRRTDPSAVGRPGADRLHDHPRPRQPLRHLRPGGRAGRQACGGQGAGHRPRPPERHDPGAGDLPRPVGAAGHHGPELHSDHGRHARERLAERSVSRQCRAGDPEPAQPHRRTAERIGHGAGPDGGRPEPHQPRHVGRQHPQLLDQREERRTLGVSGRDPVRRSPAQRLSGRGDLHGSERRSADARRPAAERGRTPVRGRLRRAGRRAGCEYRRAAASGSAGRPLHRGRRPHLGQRERRREPPVGHRRRLRPRHGRGQPPDRRLDRPAGQPGGTVESFSPWGEGGSRSETDEGPLIRAPPAPPFSLEGEGRNRREVGSAHTRRHRVFGLGLGRDLVQSDAVGQFDQLQARTVRLDVEDGQVGDDAVDHARAGQRQGAFLQNLGRAVLGDVIHHHDDALDPGDQIHSAAHALHHLAGDGPVGQIAVGGDLHRPQHGHVDMAAADHGEAVGRGEEAGGRQHGHGLLSGVDQIGVRLALEGEGADADRREVPARRGRPSRHGSSSCRRLLARTRRQLLDALFIDGREDDAVDIDARRVDGVGIEGAFGDDLLDLDHGGLSGRRHVRIEVARRLAEHQVPGRIGPPGLDDRQVGAQPGLAHIIIALEGLDGLALGDDGADAGAGIEGGDACAPRPDAFGQGALRVQFKFQFAGQILLLEQLVLADIAGDHLLHLTALQQHPQAEAVGACIVGDDGQPADPGSPDLGDQALGVAREPEAAGHDGHAVKQQAPKRGSGRGENLGHEPQVFRSGRRAGAAGQVLVAFVRSALQVGKLYAQSTDGGRLARPGSGCGRAGPDAAGRGDRPGCGADLSATAGADRPDSGRQAESGRQRQGAQAERADGQRRLGFGLLLAAGFVGPAGPGGSSRARRGPERGSSARRPYHHRDRRPRRSRAHLSGPADQCGRRGPVRLLLHQPADRRVAERPRAHRGPAGRHPGRLDLAGRALHPADAGEEALFLRRAGQPVSVGRHRHRPERPRGASRRRPAAAG